VKACGAELVGNDMMIAGYPDKIAEGGIEVTSQYFMYTETGKLEDVVCNPEYQNNQYGVAINYQLFATKG